MLGAGGDISQDTYFSLCLLEGAAGGSWEDEEQVRATRAQLQLEDPSGSWHTPGFNLPQISDASSRLLLPQAKPPHQEQNLKSIYTVIKIAESGKCFLQGGDLNFKYGLSTLDP